MSGSNNKSTTTRWTFGGRRRQAAQLPPPPQPPPPPPLSTFSTNSVADSAWASSDFMMGVGMVIIQQNTHKIVVVYERQLGYWFFPPGRKDIGETLEHAALREAYEEVCKWLFPPRVYLITRRSLSRIQSGYRASFLPLYHFTRQPATPENLEAKNLPNTEPIFLTFKSWQPRKNAKGEFIDAGGEYLTTWYAGQIPEEAVCTIPSRIWYCWIG